MGSYVAEFLHEQGGIVIAVSDYDHVIYNPEGVDIPAVQKHYKTAPYTLAGYPGCDTIAKQDILYLKCDVLVPAAIGGVITRAFHHS